MRDAAKILVLLTVLVIAPGIRAQDANVLAEQEAVKRQEATIRLHQKVIERIAGFSRALGLSVLGVIESPLLGPKGNKEFFIHLQK